MKTMQIGKLKSDFSKVLEDVKNGEEIVISYGKKNEKIAVIVPYRKYALKNSRKLGILEGKATYRFNGDFSMSEEEFLDS